MMHAETYRFVRSLGRNASLHAVTFMGIDDFLDSDDAGDGGLVMLVHAADGEEAGGLHGGPRVGDILLAMKGLPQAMQETARPLAVVTIAGADGEVGLRMARRLMGRVDASSGVAPGHLGPYESLVDDVARAIPQVLGVDPFPDRGAPN